jgi:hypothetical protein
LAKSTPAKKFNIQTGESLFNARMKCHGERDSKLDKVIDEIRLNYGKESVKRSCFLHSGVKSMTEGVGEEDYSLMASIL